MNDLLQNANREFNTEDIDFRALERAKRYISDKDYFMFIAEKTNGGYFYSNSLHIYGYCSDPNYHSIEEMNKILKTQLKDILVTHIVLGRTFLAINLCTVKEELRCLTLSQEIER